VLDRRDCSASRHHQLRRKRQQRQFQLVAHQPDAARHAAVRPGLPHLSDQPDGTHGDVGEQRHVRRARKRDVQHGNQAWDSAGRPTAGRSNGGLTIANTYDDAAHTWTATQTQPNGTTSVATNRFDANGNETRLVLVQGNTTTTTTFTITSTATVCK
jgi:hypothetical protein